jgi:hypothetical protein
LTSVELDNNNRKFKGYREETAADSSSHLIAYVDIVRPSNNIKDRSWSLCKICARNGFPLEHITFNQAIVSKIVHPDSMFYARRVVVGRLWAPLDYFSMGPHEHKQRKKEGEEEAAAATTAAAEPTVLGSRAA